MKKEDIEFGDVLTTENGEVAYVGKINNTGISVIINNKKDFILNDRLPYWKLANPIKDNRLVSSYTFAVRFKHFLDWIPVDWWMSQPHYYEEFQYMKSVANRLLKYQLATITDENEIKYFKNLKML